MHSVYKITITPLGRNSHGVSREEEWNSEIIRSFTTLKEARDFVLEKSKTLPDFIKLSETLKEEKEIQSFLETFCFDEKYTHYNRYIINKEGIQKFIKSIKKQIPHVIVN